jgi:hypothetical protein
LFYKIAHVFSPHVHLAEPNHRDGWREMPWRHSAVGGVWGDVQMVFPSPSPGTIVYRGEATNPSFVASVVDPVHSVTPLFETMQITFPKLQCHELVMSQQTA